MKHIAQNPITGEELKTGANSKAFDEGYEKAFGKKIVHYCGEGHIVVGEQAWVENVDHPLFDKGAILHTSRVKSLDENTGTFETHNTTYVRVPR